MVICNRIGRLGLALCVLAACASLSLAQSQAPSACARDLEAVAETLQHNYAGYTHAKKMLGKRLDEALAAARKAAVGASGAKGDAVIRQFLAVFEDGHLLLSSRFSPPVNMPPPLFHAKRAPLARALSDRAFLLRVPSFAIGYKAELDALLEQHKDAIRARATLIVDVRGNTGGADSTWTHLIDPIYSQPMKRWGIRWRPTEDNARAIEEQIAQLRKGSRAPAAVCEAMQQNANDMRKQRHKDLVRLGPPLVPLVTLPEVWPSPDRVAIIVDGSCGSSCENFLLAARQSSKVIVFGARTYGAIDFQNVRMADLPSGERQLRFAMSISERVFAAKQRQRGLIPNVELPPQVLRDPEAAIEHVLRALDSKSGGAP